MLTQADTFQIDHDFLTLLLYPVVAGMLILFVGWLLDRRQKRRTEELKSSVAETKYEITNEHQQPLRTDLDSKFALVFGKLNNVIATQTRHDRLFKQMAKVQIGTRQDIAELNTGQAQHTADIEELQREIDLKNDPPAH